MALDLARLEESPHLIDILIQMEDVIDSLDIYVFTEWMNGEVVAGPDVRRYWLGMTLEYQDKPDERGAMRLIKHGLQVKMSRAQKGEHSSPTSPSHAQKVEPIWLVNIQIPRRLVSDMNAGQLDFYDEEGEIDVEDVQDANDAGMTDETGYVEDDDSAGAAPDAAPEGVDDLTK